MSQEQSFLLTSQYSNCFEVYCRLRFCLRSIVKKMCWLAEGKLRLCGEQGELDLPPTLLDPRVVQLSTIRQRQAPRSARATATRLILQQSWEHPEQERRSWLSLGPFTGGGQDTSASRQELLAVLEMQLHPHVALNYLKNYRCTLQQIC